VSVDSKMCSGIAYLLRWDSKLLLPIWIYCCGGCISLRTASIHRDIPGDITGSRHVMGDRGATLLRNGELKDLYESPFDVNKSCTLSNGCWLLRIGAQFSNMQCMQ
jgi:hypothetical protein